MPDLSIKISVIVCTCNRCEDLQRFLDSLDIQSQPPDELIIIDASTDDRTRQLIQSRQPQKYETVYERTTPGLTRQRNIGIDKSRGAYLYFFDDDVVLEREFIAVIDSTFQRYVSERSVRTKSNDRKLGGMTGKITNISKKKMIDAVFQRLFFLSSTGKGVVKPSGFPAYRCNDTLASVTVMSGCAMVYTREAVCGYSFDEALQKYAYMEDVDFSYRVSKRFTLIYQPHARLGHRSTTYKTANTRNLRRMMIRNHAYLFGKNMPHDPLHWCAFYLSIAGLFLYNLFIARDFNACKGIIEGVVESMNVNFHD
ncbi:MAG: glycosyltransferase family 2 protein [Chitinivibrionales bacterium]|nr:glycosyltransferase family 2 protein [Chitinivibrionales bacterium]